MSNSEEKISSIELLSNLTNEVTKIEMLIMLDLRKMIKKTELLMKQNIDKEKNNTEELNTTMKNIQNIDVIEQKLSHIILFHRQIQGKILPNNHINYSNKLKLDLCSELLLNSCELYINTSAYFAKLSTKNSKKMENDTIAEYTSCVRKTLKWCLTVGYPSIPSESIDIELDIESELSHMCKYYTMNSEREVHQRFIALKTGKFSGDTPDKKQFVDIELF